MISSRSYRNPISVLILAVVSHSCAEQKLVSPTEINSNNLSSSPVENSTAIQNTFNAAVGSPIDQQTALRWMSNFTKSNASAVRDHYIQGNTLKEIMSNAACVGISLYYAADASGSLHIIPVGVDASGRVIAMQTTAIDNAALSWQTVWQWINNYSGSARSHFFGTQTFSRLLFSQKSITIRIARALNDSGSPQLLLSNAAVVDPPTYEDDSIICPPVCPNNK